MLPRLATDLLVFASNTPNTLEVEPVHNLV
jgi:hypothetical protein